MKNAFAQFKINLWYAKKQFPVVNERDQSLNLLAAVFRNQVTK